MPKADPPVNSYVLVGCSMVVTRAVLRTLSAAPAITRVRTGGKKAKGIPGCHSLANKIPRVILAS
jgi:hypothetical protein